MFNKSLVASDAFLDMPLTTQLLYFHMGMEADDDGFVGNPKRIMRMLGVQDDDLKILVSKRFIIPFDSGVCVIKHWRMNNMIRKDRYNHSSYTKELTLLYLNENSSYTLENTGIPAVNHRLTDGQPRIEENSIVKNSIEKNKTLYGDQKFQEFWNVYPRKVGKGVAWTKWKQLKLSAEEKQQVIDSVEKYKNTDQWKKDNGQFIPHPSTFLYQRRFEDEIEEGSSSSDIVKI